MDHLRFDKKADVCQCSECKLVFLDQNSFEYPPDFYEKEYHQSYLTHVEPDALDPKAYYEKMKKATRLWAERFMGMLNGNETVLDMGCSTGHFMDLIKSKTGALHGYDLNANEVNFCKNELELNVSNAPLADRFEENTFDYITLMFVLEHIADPVAFLNHLKKFLKPDGKLLIVVPNISDPLVSLYEIPEFRSFYYCIEHLFYYNQKSIAALFEKANLKGEVDAVQEYPLANHLNWVYKRKPSNSLAARRGVPDVEMINEDPAWEELWERFDAVYRSFLAEKGYADRLWCLVGKS
jgi:2-polyprenyl-3-methyl-5-hydroxy-6-metoxy-1,4-benzoquinol methylase